MSAPDRFAEFRDRPSAAEAPAPGQPQHEQAHEQEAGVLRPALVMGLGNPGADYGNTRHNVGVWCVNLLARRFHAQLERQGRVDRADISIDGHRLAIARPRTYMNESGPAIAAELQRLHVEPSQLLVIYDDLDLPVGKVRLRLQGGHGGNNGMRSIIASIGTNEFPRVRIGIDRPYEGGLPVRDPDRVAAWVLAKPSPADRERLEAAVEAVADAVALAVRVGLEVAMNRLNATEEAHPAN